MEICRASRKCLACLTSVSAAENPTHLPQVSTEQLAANTTAAERGGIDKDSGYKPGSFSRSMVRDRTAHQRFPASGQMLVIRPYVKKLRKKREERISFQHLRRSDLVPQREILRVCRTFSSRRTPSRQRLSCEIQLGPAIPPDSGKTGRCAAAKASTKDEDIN
jgi:hypothetical protein